MLLRLLAARRPALRYRPARRALRHHPECPGRRTWLHWLIFGGDFPGTLIIPRLYVAHVLLLPGIILALIAAHLALVWYQKHTQSPAPAAPRRTSSAFASSRCSLSRVARSSRSRSVSWP
ncbi:hypothetical protein GS584_07550 [Rhodococcus hoagii]|nr:hypothetical protein [Prescottella equi]